MMAEMQVHTDTREMRMVPAATTTNATGISPTSASVERQGRRDVPGLNWFAPSPHPKIASEKIRNLAPVRR